MNHLNRDTTPIEMRNYGRILQNMIRYACTVTNEGEQRALTRYIAQCMMQKNMIWNADQESGVDRVKGDIVRMSGGKLPVAELDDLVVVPQNTQFVGKKKKK